MKQRFILLVLNVSFVLNLYSQSLAINNTGALSDSSAILDITSTSKGILIPRMSLLQRNAINNPASGLLIWCIDCDEFQVYNGIIWKNINGYAACSSPEPPGVKICGQTWMVKNLDVANYRNGDPIPHVTDTAVWASLTTGAYCYFNNDSATYAATYGKLYNWYAVNDPRGLASNGWHVPIDSEWKILVKCIDPLADTTIIGVQSTIVGGAMKETDTLHWLPPNTGATNITGFTGLPGGYRIDFGHFGNVRSWGYFWSATELSITNAYNILLQSNNGNVFRAPDHMRRGMSVRCVKD